MSDIHRVIVQLEVPRPGNPGRVTNGYYRIEGDKVIMTGENGRPIVDNHGTRYEGQAGEGISADSVACILTRKISDKVRGNDSFNRVINYSTAPVI